MCPHEILMKSHSVNCFTVFINQSISAEDIKFGNPNVGVEVVYMFVEVQVGYKLRSRVSISRTSTELAI